MWPERGIVGQPLKPDELEIELQFPPDHDGRALCNRHLHIGCFKAWEWVASRHGVAGLGHGYRPPFLATSGANGGTPETG